MQSISNNYLYYTDNATLIYCKIYIPYQNTHQICDLYMVSKKMETLCKCRYFAFKTINTSLTECSYSDMVTCGNKIVQSYIFNKSGRGHQTTWCGTSKFQPVLVLRSQKSGKHHKQESCSPSCLSYGFQLNEITVSACYPNNLWLFKLLSIAIELKMATVIFVERYDFG